MKFTTHKQQIKIKIQQILLKLNLIHKDTLKSIIISDSQLAKYYFTDPPV